MSSIPVAVLQEILSTPGYEVGKIDGIPGPKFYAAAKVVAKDAGANVKDDPKNLMVVAEQYVMDHLGLDVGKIDGFNGPVTEAAREAFFRLDWRGTINSTRPGDNFPALVLNTWPKQSAVRSFYGAPGTGLVTFTVPYKLRLAWDLDVSVSKITAHAKVKDSTLRVLEAVKAVYGEAEIKRLRLDVYGGTYNNRAMRGGTALSMHAYGIAHDWDPERNQLKWGRDRASLARPEYDKWWEAWTKEGWFSLGKARNYDWMHVQAATI